MILVRDKSKFNSVSRQESENLKAGKTLALDKLHSLIQTANGKGRLLPLYEGQGKE